MNFLKFSENTYKSKLRVSIRDPICPVDTNRGKIGFQA